MLSLIFTLTSCVVAVSWGECLLMFSFLMFSMLMMSSDSLMCKVMGGFELDLIGFIFVLLSVWICLLSGLSSMKVKWGYEKGTQFMITLVLLLNMLVLSFSFSSYLMFYVSFEGSLVPTLCLIMGWGYQPERMRAGMYMFFYTLFGSLPLFLVFVYMMLVSGGSYMYMNYSLESGFILKMFVMVAFLVKFPMYLVHLWLPKAHVEAPVAGSMILAGVLLKLGGYGIIRVSPMINGASLYMVCLVISVSLWGGILVSLSCMRLGDMKMVVAYSSVVHMGLCLGGLLVMSEWGATGSMWVMLGHGLCSSGLFFLVNIIYSRSSSRSMLLNKGLLNLMPSLSFSWFIMLAGNMAAPPSINLLGEISLFISLVGWDYSCMFMLVFISFFSAAYSLYLYSTVQHGEALSLKGGYESGVVLEHFISFLHWMPLLGLIVCLNYFL